MTQYLLDNVVSPLVGEANGHTPYAGGRRPDATT